MIADAVILTPAENATALAFNNPSYGFQFGAASVTGATPGVGINKNENATNYALDDEVPLMDAFVAGISVLTDPEYIAYLPGLVTFLHTLPVAEVDTEVIFAPCDC